MRPTDACTAPGVILGTAGPVAWWVELPNGHRLIARILRRDADVRGNIVPGASVVVMVSPGDMSKGVLVRETEFI